MQELDTRYKEIKIKQHKHVNYLGCVWYETMSDEIMALRVIEKINSRLKFLYRKNQFLDASLRRILCNALIPVHFYYACTAWYPDLTKKLKDKLQVTQNKCIRISLKLQCREHLSNEHFKKLNLVIKQIFLHLFYPALLWLKDHNGNKAIRLFCFILAILFFLLLILLLTSTFFVCC